MQRVRRDAEVKDNDMCLTEKAIAYIRELFRGNAGGHDVDHMLRVRRNAERIAAEEPGCDHQVVVLAALLHDADDPKLFHTENNGNARAFLEENRVPDELTEKIIDTINAVSFSRNCGRIPKTIEGRIVQDADRLDAMGAVGIARTFAYGGEHGRPLSDSIRHFYDKLLLLKDMINTETGKRLAEKRHEYLKEFLKEFDQESD